MTVSYCAFLRDGRFVSTTPFTLSIVQCSLPDAMNRESSLRIKHAHERQTSAQASPTDETQTAVTRGETRSPVDEVDADAEGGAHAFQREAAVALKKLGVRQDAHLADVVSGVGVKEAGGDKVILLKFGWAIR